MNLIRVLLSIFLLAFVSVPIHAHPLPNMRFDRKVDVRLTPTMVTVKYTLELTYWTVVVDGKGLITQEEEEKIGGRFVAYTKRYTEKKAPLVADGLRATLNGQDLNFVVTKADIEPDRDHAKIRFEFQAPLKLLADKENVFHFEDQNFEDKVGVVWLTLATDTAFMVKDLIEPLDLRGKSPYDMKPSEVERLRKASAWFTVPADLLPKEQSAPLPSGPVTAEVHDRPDPGLIRDMFERGLKVLFDDKYGVGVLLFAAMIFGGFHAFTPGHGKTLVAAYLVGERGTVKHAAVLALSTTLAHTGTVIAIAGVLWWAYRGKQVPPETQGWLQLAGGLLLFVVGGWLLIRRIQGKADHIHLTGRCASHAGFGCRPASELPADPSACGVCGDKALYVSAETKTSWTRVILLGIGGGIVPCWDAIMLLLVAISAGRLAFALPLLVAFSIGLGAVLVGLGALVVYAHSKGGQKFGERAWFKFLPAVSAALLVFMGGIFLRDGLRVLQDAQRPVAKANQG